MNEDRIIRSVIALEMRAYLSGKIDGDLDSFDTAYHMWIRDREFQSQPYSWQQMVQICSSVGYMPHPGYET